MLKWLIPVNNLLVVGEGVGKVMGEGVGEGEGEGEGEGVAVRSTSQDGRSFSAC